MNELKITTYKADWLTLFDYEQNDSRTIIKILPEQTNFKRRAHGKDIKGNSLARLVRFKLCGLDLSDSFEALSILLSLVKVFEHRQFGTGSRQLSMHYSALNDPYFRFFCAPHQYEEAYEGLRIGWFTVRGVGQLKKEHIMHIGYVHHLRNALHRAMGWISPETRIQHVELPDIKEDLGKLPSSSTRHGGFY